jgi:hypothetical protein
MFKQEQEIYQMFAGYLHQDWRHEYIWDEGEKPDFRAAIEAYKEDCQNTPLILNETIKELEELINKNYTNHVLESLVFRELGIAINPEAFGLTYQQFLQEILKILKE